MATQDLVLTGLTPYVLPLDSVVLTANKVTFQLPKAAQRVLAIILRGGNSAAANTNAPASAGAIFKEFRWNYGGDIVKRADMTRYQKILTDIDARYAPRLVNDYDGTAVNGNGRVECIIMAAEPYREFMQHKDALGFQTSFLRVSDTHKLEVDFAAGITGACEAFAIVDDFNEATEPHQIMAVEEITKAATVKGPFLIEDLDSIDPYSLITIFDTSGGKTVERVELKRGTATPRTLIKNENTGFNKLFANMNPAAGAYQIPGDVDDNLTKLGDSRGLKLNITLNAAPGANDEIYLIAQRLRKPVLKR